MPMMAITTSNSTSVKPRQRLNRNANMKHLQTEEKEKRN